MLKIRTKLFLFFLINAIFLCLNIGSAILYVQKLSASLENSTILRKASDEITVYSDNFPKIARSYSVINAEKYDSLKSEADFSLLRFDDAIKVIQKDGNSKDFALSMKKIKDQYADLLDKISKNRKYFSEQAAKNNDTLALLKKIRNDLTEMSKSMSAKTKLSISETGYNENEFNYQFNDKQHSIKWLSSINSLRAASAEEKSQAFSDLVNEYTKAASLNIAEKESITDLQLNYGYYLAKIDNTLVENHIQNALAIDYTDSMIRKIQEDNGVFKIFAVLFIISLLLLGSVFMIIYSGKITKPILELTKISKQIMSGDLSVRANVKSNDEIGYLSMAFNNMLDNINEKNDKLKKESIRLKTLLSSISEGLLLIDSKFNIILANITAAKILRTHSHSLEGKNLTQIIDILHDMDNVPVKKWPFEHVFSTSRSITLKLSDGYYFKTKEGRIFPIEIMVAPIDIENNKAAVAVFKDVTEMKLIEEEREFSRKNLESVLKGIYIERDNVQEEKDKLEALLNSMGDAVLAIDEEKRIMAFNPVAEKITGFKLTELEKYNFDKKIKFIEEETKKEKSDFVDQVLSKGEKMELNNLAIFNKKEKMILVDINAAPIKNYKGKIIGCIIIFKDVTFKREAERMRTDFISIVSHQLRTPLSAMKWFLEILLDEDVGKLKKEQRDVVNEIHESNSNMINFVNQMLNVSRIESRRLAINVEKIKLCDTITELLKEIKPFFTEKKQKISFSCIAEKELAINTDKNLLRNVLSSILLNASRYSPQKKGIIDLNVSRLNKDFVLFKITDNGIGIPEDEKVKIFRKFARASNAIRYEANGTGLGLYIVKSLINMVCGKVWFESQENKGTTFYFTLPIENMVCEIDENDAKMLI